MCCTFHSKTSVKWPLKIDKTKMLMATGSLMKVGSIAECSLGAFCNTFDLHLAIIGLENQFSVFLRFAVLHRFYCMCKTSLDTHADILHRARGLNICLSLHLHPYFVYVSG